MKIRLGLAAIIGMLCLMVGVIAGGRAAISNPDGELAAGELTTAGTDDGHAHGEGDDHADHADGDHADGDHAHADGDHADGDHADGDHGHATGATHAHDPSDPSHADGDHGHADDPSDPNHAHDPTDPTDPTHPHNPSDPTHPTPPELTYTDEQLDLLTRTQRWIYPRFANVKRAEEAGYHSIGDSVTGFEHYVNSAYLNSDEILNPQTIESLVYRVSGAQRILVSGMYILPLGDSLADVPSAWDTPQSPWHIHTNLCWSLAGGAFRVVGTTDPNNPSCPPGSIYFITPPMLHVWINEQPCGWFSDLEQVETGDCTAHPH
jgi:hypothetical protein